MMFVILLYRNASPTTKLISRKEASNGFLLIVYFAHACVGSGNVQNCKDFLSKHSVVIYVYLLEKCLYHNLSDKRFSRFWKSETEMWKFKDFLSNHNVIYEASFVKQII